MPNKSLYIKIKSILIQFYEECKGLHSLSCKKSESEESEVLILLELACSNIKAENHSLVIVTTSNMKQYNN